MLDEEGRPDFGLLQQSLGASGKQAKATAPPTPSFTLSILCILMATICAVSNIGPADTFLEDTLNGSMSDRDRRRRLSETLDGDPAVLLESTSAARPGRHRRQASDQPYRSGRTGDWVKACKCVQERQAFFIVGYRGRRYLRAGFGSCWCSLSGLPG